jgi:hypothetical protein
MFSRVTLFHLTEEKDVGYLSSNGIPAVESPTGNYIFNQWVKEPGGLVSPAKTGRLILPQDYLDQLAAA